MTPHRFRIASVLAAVGWTVASTALAVSIEGPTTYAAGSAVAAAATLVAGWALVLVGAWAWWERSGSSGPVILALGVTWLAPLWVGWDGGPPLVRSLAMLLVPIAPSLLLHLALMSPSGQLESWLSRRVMAGAYALTIAYSLVKAAVHDPFLDLHCWSNCSDNVFLVRADPGLSRALDSAWVMASLVTGLVVGGVAARRFRATSVVGRHLYGPVLLPLAATGVSQAVSAGLLLSDPADGPDRAVFVAAYLLRAASWTALAGGTGWALSRTHRTRTALQHVTDGLGTAADPAPLEASLASALDDSSVQVAYWLTDPERYVDSEGREWDPPSADRTATPIVRRGEPVAVVVHDPAVTVTARLAAEIGQAARLAVDNERLRAGLLAQLADLRASRVRIVEAADTTRQRLERDLHDGAQQRLLALTYELRMARADAAARGDRERERGLARACELAQAAVTDLRDLAHGIYPAVLTESGLGPALWSLSDTVAVPVRIADVPEERFAEPVERAAYVVVSSVIDADPRDDLAVAVAAEEGSLVVSVSPVRHDPDVGVVDRVGALGGRIVVQDGTLRAELPCG